jgi:nicotinamidase-related amidase
MTNSTSYPSLRQLSGAKPSSALDAATTALLVIDFQQEYFSGKLPIPDGLSALQQAKHLIAKADQTGMTVVHIQHVAPAGSGFFAADSPTVEFHPEILPKTNHLVIQKTMASSFVATRLQEELAARGIKAVLLAGLMTHNCISSTARDAKPHGYQIMVAADACATRSISAWDGSVVEHRDLHRACLTGLSDTFAEVRNTEDILRLF